VHHEELHNFYSSSNIVKVIKSRKVRLPGYVECMRYMTTEYKILVVGGKKRPLERPRSR